MSRLDLKGMARSWLDAWRVKRILRAWRTYSANTKSSSGAIQRIAILPSDPWTLVGARGDEAMMQAVVGRLRVSYPAVEVGVVVASDVAAAAAVSMGFKPMHVWSNGGVGPIVRGLLEARVDALFVLGADAIDGFYSPKTSLQLLATADCCARSGVRAVLLGFSFNASPDPDVLAMFDGVSPELVINVRDPISFGRFKAKTRANARLVADSAFMLKPDDSGESLAEAAAWVGARKSQGHAVVGFNAHPLLVKSLGAAGSSALVRSAVEALRRFLAGNNVSIALISHDYRQGDGDDVCLAPIYAALREGFGDRIYYPSEQLSAAQLKALAGYMDGVVTGRMHLAIAALGMGVPTAALTYQDKFQGLFEHFGLPQDLLMPPNDALDTDRLSALLERFAKQLPALRDQVGRELPGVKEKSFLNMAGLL